MTKSAFITDGFERDGYIAETEFYPSCSFKYRPCTDTENQVLKKKVEREERIRGVEASLRVQADWLASRIIDWDLVDPGGHPVHPTGRNFEKLGPVFYTRMWGILLGERLSDPRPGEPEPKSEEEIVKN